MIPEGKIHWDPMDSWNYALEKWGKRLCKSTQNSLNQHTLTKVFIEKFKWTSVTSQLVYINYTMRQGRWTTP